MNNTVLEFDIFKDEYGRTIIQINGRSFKRLLLTVALAAFAIGVLLVTSIGGFII